MPRLLASPSEGSTLSTPLINFGREERTPGGTVVKRSQLGVRWLVLALARFVALKYLGHAFGTTFYRHTLSEDAAITYEICDDYPKLSAGLCAETCSARLLDYLARRGTLVLHMVEQRVGAEALQDTIATCIRQARGRPSPVALRC